jgi:thymidylate kinase
MCSSRIELSLDEGQSTRIERFLIEKERSYYQRILPPDQMIVFRVEPEIAIERKLDEPTEHVSIRSKELWDANWSDTHAKLVDAGQPREKVIDEVRSLVWAEL